MSQIINRRDFPVERQDVVLVSTLADTDVCCFVRNSIRLKLSFCSNTENEPATDCLFSPGHCRMPGRLQFSPDYSPGVGVRISSDSDPRLRHDETMAVVFIYQTICSSC